MRKAKKRERTGDENIREKKERGGQGNGEDKQWE